MGKSQSKQVNEIFQKEAVRVTTNVINKNQTKASTSGKAIQEMKVKIVADSILCNLDINQTQEQRVKTIVQFTNESTNELKTQLNTAMQAAFEQVQGLESELGGGWGSFVNQDMQNKVHTEIEKVVESNITTENINQVIQRFDAEQGMDVIIQVGKWGTPGEPCSITQAQYQDIVAEQIIGNTVKTLLDSSVANELKTEIEQTQDIEQKGLAQLVTSIGDAVSSVISAATGPFIALIGAALLFLLLGGGAISGSTSEPTVVPNPMNPSQPMLQPASRSTGKVMIGVLFILLAITGVVLAIVYWPSEEERQEAPEEVQEMGCDAEWKAAKEVQDELGVIENDAPTAEQGELLLENKDILCEYSDCMEEENEACKESFAYLYDRLAVPKPRCPCTKCVMYLS